MDVGTLLSSGAIYRKFAGGRFLSGSILFSGIIQALKNVVVILRSVVGTLSWAGGVVVRKVVYKRIETGLVFSSGKVIRKFVGERSVHGSISFSGIVREIKNYVAILAGTIFLRFKGKPLKFSFKSRPIFKFEK